MINLIPALYCIATMKQKGTYSGEKIGRVRKEITGMVTVLDPGRIVLYSEHEDGTLKVEYPMSQEQIKRQQEKGSLITTMGTIINVPKSLVERINV